MTNRILACALAALLAAPAGALMRKEEPKPKPVKKAPLVLSEKQINELLRTLKPFLEEEGKKKVKEQMRYGSWGERGQGGGCLEASSDEAIKESVSAKPAANARTRRLRRFEMRLKELIRDDPRFHVNFHRGK